MLHRPRINDLAHCLACPIPPAAGRRRRALLGAVLEHKAATGFFDLELLHHWLDVALELDEDRRLFGLDRAGTPHRPNSVRSARVHGDPLPGAFRMTTRQLPPAERAIPR